MIDLEHPRLYHHMSDAAQINSAPLRENRAIAAVSAGLTPGSGVANHVLHFGDHVVASSGLPKKRLLAGISMLEA